MKVTSTFYSLLLCYGASCVLFVTSYFVKCSLSTKQFDKNNSDNQRSSQKLHKAHKRKTTDEKDYHSVFDNDENDYQDVSYCPYGSICCPYDIYHESDIDDDIKSHKNIDKNHVQFNDGSWTTTTSRVTGVACIPTSTNLNNSAASTTMKLKESSSQIYNDDHQCSNCCYDVDDEYSNEQLYQSYDDDYEQQDCTVVDCLKTKRRDTTGSNSRIKNNYSKNKIKVGRIRITGCDNGYECKKIIRPEVETDEENQNNYNGIFDSGSEYHYYCQQQHNNHMNLRNVFRHNYDNTIVERKYQRRTFLSNMYQYIVSVSLSSTTKLYHYIVSALLSSTAKLSIVIEKNQYYQQSQQAMDSIHETIQQHSSNQDRYQTYFHDPLTPILPRYRGCYQEFFNNANNNYSGYNMYMFPMMNQTTSSISSTTNHTRTLTTTTTVAYIPYYSNYGNIHLFGQLLDNHNSERKNTKNKMYDTMNDDPTTTIPTRAVIVIHGANRNADDYYCSVLAASDWYTNHILEKEHVWVIVPRFTISTDTDATETVLPFHTDSNNNNNNNNPTSSPSSSIEIQYYVMQWNGTNVAGGGEWRYGANAIVPAFVQNNNSSSSSFAVIDRIVQYLLQLNKTITTTINKQEQQQEMTTVTTVPLLKQISIVGHSSGGQFVQRWSLLTSIWDDKSNNKDKENSTTTTSTTANHTTQQIKHGRIKSVVANPSSYAYLTNKRWNDTIQKWMVPPLTVTTTTTTKTNELMSFSSTDDGWYTECPSYNQWQFGLEPDYTDTKTPTAVPTATIQQQQEEQRLYRVPYVNYAMNQIDNNMNVLIERFGKRHVVYLIGSLDQCNVSSSSSLSNNNSSDTTHPWCDSHGLETLCQDMIQGKTRYERHWNYYHHLLELVYNNYYSDNYKNDRNDTDTFKKNNTHYAQPTFIQERHTVPGVGHDHSLMFNSQEGLDAIFGPVAAI